MAKVSKRVRAFKEKIDPQKVYPLDVAVSLLKEFATVKFNETVEVAVNLGIDARKSDQAVRGATTLPFGTGTQVRVAVFTQGEAAEKAIAEAAKRIGRLDVLVANAGISIDGLLLRLKDDDFDRILNINVKGAVACARAITWPDA